MQKRERASSAPRRRYDASRRQADARARQARVVDAARQLFLSQGYGGTSIAEIARAADVSVQFVYASFESKAGVLSRVVDVAVAGDDAELPVIDRPEARAVLAGTEVAAQLRATAHLARLAHERSAPLLDLVERASATDPALAELAARLDAGLRRDTRTLAETLPRHALRPELGPDEVAGLLYVLVSHRTWTGLVQGCGWTPEQYEERLERTLRALLLPG